MIVDCFPFFAPYGEELLYLRVNMLKDHVDKFIIVESDKTHSGIDVPLRFEQIAENLKLPMEKIIYVPHHIPEKEDIQLLEMDRINAGVDQDKEDSLYARARERMQKDAVMVAIEDPKNNFQDDDIFIYGDGDEIIDPKNIGWISNIVKRSSENVLIKIPLVYLQCRADLRIHHQDNKPVVWWRAMFFAKKSQIMKTSINQLRCGFNVPYTITWPTHHGKVCQDLGWHFAWMGTDKQREIKAESYAHAYDHFNEKTMNVAEYETHVDVNRAIENGNAPHAKDRVFRRYPIEKLPKMIFDVPFVESFLLPKTDMSDRDFKFNPCTCSWCEKLKWPLLHDLDGEKYWFEIPRSCSVTMKETFRDRVTIMRDDPKYQEVVKNNEPLVVFTDPIDRFISLINVYITKDQRYYHYGKDIFNSFGKNLEDFNEPTNEKVSIFMENLHKIVGKHQVHHFHPQVKFIDTEQFEKFTVIKRKDLNKHLGIATVINRTRKELTLEHFTEEQIEFIKSIYDADYKFYEKYG